MTLKKDSQALEKLYTVDIVGARFRSYLLDEKRQALAKGFIIPDNLISEIEEFKDRNAIVHEKGEKICCEQCLKAYALHRASKYGLGKDVGKKLGKMFKGNAGHNGYYLDKEELIKI